MHYGYVQLWHQYANACHALDISQDVSTMPFDFMIVLACICFT